MGATLIAYLKQRAKQWKRGDQIMRAGIDVALVLKRTIGTS